MYTTSGAMWKSLRKYSAVDTWELTIFTQLFSLNVLEKSVYIACPMIWTACGWRLWRCTKSSLARITHAAPSDVGLNDNNKHTSRCEVKLLHTWPTTVNWSRIPDTRGFPLLMPMYSLFREQILGSVIVLLSRVQQSRTAYPLTVAAWYWIWTL